jgi:hypothetical protein
MELYWSTDDWLESGIIFNQLPIFRQIYSQLLSERNCKCINFATKINNLSHYSMYRERKTVYEYMNNGNEIEEENNYLKE